MNILVIVGSPKGKGNSYKVTRQVEGVMKQLGNVEFEYLMLKDANLELCRGCFRCIAQGEHLCPLKDDRARIEEQMMASDGVIFVSPVYVYNVSWLMKNFIDRFAYVCHRPRFHGKKALVISTTGGVGLRRVLSLLAFPATTWGFTVVHKLGVRVPPGPLPAKVVEKEAAKTARDVERAAHKFFQAVASTEPLSPGLLKLGQFIFQKDVFARGEDSSNVDYQYWKSKGWLENGARYFYRVRVNVWMWGAAWLLAKVIVLTLPRAPRIGSSQGVL